MKIELDEDAILRLTKAAVDQAKNQMVAAVMAQFNAQQIAAEVKNAAVREAAKIIADRVQQKIGSSQVIDRALQSVESRVNSSIHAALEKGIVVKLASLIGGAP